MIIFLIITALLLYGISKFYDNKEEAYISKDAENFLTLPSFNATPINDGGAEPKEEIVAILKTPSVDITKIHEYQGNTLKKFEFRPQNFQQFIGQEKAKERAQTIIRKAERGDMKTHFFVDGMKGSGKTSFVKIIAKHLKAKFIERIGKQINEENIVDLINEINDSPEKYVILFIDEMDSMDSKVVKILNPIIESFEISGKKIKPFIFAGATINKHILLKNNPDTLDRIQAIIKFSRYSEKEIVSIIRQYQTHLYRNETVPEETFKKISCNCKLNPRTSISLLEDYIIIKNIDKVLTDRSIIVNGLTDIDLKILKILSKAPRAMGANSVAMRCGLTEKEYVGEFEPFLYEFGYINRVPSRVIGEKGIELLNQLS